MVSRNHLAITREGGKAWALDRGSAFGTIVNSREIGGRHNSTRAPLDQEKNQVIIGPATSRYIFLLNVTPEESRPTSV
ncbi:MAG: FHA domain-containing protein [Thermodesulfobacteriota bacterium]